MTFPLPDFGVFPYAATVARNYLLTRVPAPYVVTTLVPSAPRPPKLIVIRSATTGGQESPILGRRRLIIWCYDLTEFLAVTTAEYCRGYLYEAMYVQGSGIRETRVVGEPVYFPDPDDPAKTDRAQLTVDVLLRAITHLESFGS
jgi:hypothetical protein